MLVKEKSKSKSKPVRGNRNKIYLLKKLVTDLRKTLRLIGDAFFSDLRAAAIHSSVSFTVSYSYKKTLASSYHF